MRVLAQACLAGVELEESVEVRREADVVLDVELKTTFGLAQRERRSELDLVVPKPKARLVARVDGAVARQPAHHVSPRRHAGQPVRGRPRVENEAGVGQVAYQRVEMAHLREDARAHRLKINLSKGVEVAALALQYLGAVGYVGPRHLSDPAQHAVSTEGCTAVPVRRMPAAALKETADALRAAFRHAEHHDHGMLDHLLTVTGILMLCMHSFGLG